jgi:hypothetical protein
MPRTGRPYRQSPTPPTPTRSVSEARLMPRTGQAVQAIPETSHTKPKREPSSLLLATAIRRTVSRYRLILDSIAREIHFRSWIGKNDYCEFIQTEILTRAAWSEPRLRFGLVCAWIASRDRAGFGESPVNAHNFGPPMDAPLAYFLTWATYGTWLPGDQRGWVDYRRGWQLPDPVKQLEAAARMTANACILNEVQRYAVHEQVAETCNHKGWLSHAVNCRTNHLHIVVTAPVSPKIARAQLKAWCTRKLKSLQRSAGAGVCLRDEWWAERGSQRYVNDQASLEAVILYVLDGQDGPRDAHLK